MRRGTMARAGLRRTRAALSAADPMARAGNAFLCRQDAAQLDGRRMIHRALPQARILNMVRDPMDVCFSNFRTWVMGESFPWNYDLQALAAHYLQYRRVLAHWHAAMPGAVHDVSYSE